MAEITENIIIPRSETSASCDTDVNTIPKTTDIDGNVDCDKKDIPPTSDDLKNVTEPRSPTLTSKMDNTDNETVETTTPASDNGCSLQHLREPTVQLETMSEDVDCDKKDITPTSDDLKNVTEPRTLTFTSEMDNTDNETVETTPASDNGCSLQHLREPTVQLETMSKDQCGSPLAKKIKNITINSPVASIQEVVDKVTKLDLVETPVTKSVASSKVIETPSLKNLLIYNSDSSDNEAGDDLLVNQSVNRTSVFDSSDSISNVEESGDSDDEFVRPMCRNVKRELDKLDYEPTDPPTDVSNLEIDYLNEQFLHIGHISHFIHTTVTIQALENSDSYNLDTVLFVDDNLSKKPLGAITDVIGPVHSPVYCIQLHEVKDVETLGLKEGMKVYSAPKSKYTKYVFLKDLLRMKGTDASWIGDDELPSDINDSSDDEFDTQTRRPRKRSLTNSLERHKQFERTNNCSNLIKNRVATLFDAIKPKPRAPNIHMFPHGFDPRVPPPNVNFSTPNNTGVVSIPNVTVTPFNRNMNDVPYQNPSTFRSLRRGHPTNNPGDHNHHYNGAGPSYQHF